MGVGHGARLLLRLWRYAATRFVMPAEAGISLGRRYADLMRRGGWTYIMTNKPRGVLYTGVTAHIAARAYQHSRGEGSSFCRRYNLVRLVLAEEHATIEEAIAREKMIKAWRRAWKIALIEASNPAWEDLGSSLLSID